MNTGFKNNDIINGDDAHHMPNNIFSLLAEKTLSSSLKYVMMRHLKTLH